MKLNVSFSPANQSCVSFTIIISSAMKPRQAAGEVSPPNTFHLASTSGHCALVEGWDLPGSEAPAITWPPWPTLFWAIQFSAGHLGHLGSGLGHLSLLCPHSSP